MNSLVESLKFYDDMNKLSFAGAMECNGKVPGALVLENGSTVCGWFHTSKLDSFPTK